MNSLKVFNPFDVYKSFEHKKIILMNIETMTMETFLSQYCKNLQLLMKTLNLGNAEDCLFVIAGSSKVNCIVLRFMSTVWTQQVQFFLTDNEKEPILFHTYNYTHLELQSHDQINEFMKCLANGVITLENGKVSFNERKRTKFDYSFFTGCPVKINYLTC